MMCMLNIRTEADQKLFVVGLISNSYTIWVNIGIENDITLLSLNVVSGKKSSVVTETVAILELLLKHSCL